MPTTDDAVPHAPRPASATCASLFGDPVVFDPPSRLVIQSITALTDALACLAIVFMIGVLCIAMGA